MTPYLSLAVLALRPVLDVAGEAVGLGKIGALVSSPVLDHLKDHSTRVELALRTASTRAWDVIEVVLAGESILARFDRTETRGFRKQVEAFLATNSTGELDRGECLRELRAARAAGVLTGTCQESVRFAEDFVRFSDPPPRSPTNSDSSTGSPRNCPNIRFSPSS